MLHLRAVSPPDLRDQAIARLGTEPGVLNLVLHPDRVRSPDGDSIACDVLTGAANEVLRGLRDLELEHRGSIVLAPVDFAFSDRAARGGAEKSGPGCRRRCGSR